MNLGQYPTTESGLFRLPFSTHFYAGRPLATAQHPMFCYYTNFSLHVCVMDRPAHLTIPPPVDVCYGNSALAFPDVFPQLIRPPQPRIYLDFVRELV